MHVVQRVSTSQQLKHLKVSIDASSDLNLGGHVELGVAPRGQAIHWKTSTDERLAGENQRYSGWLPLDLPAEEVADVRDFDVHIILRGTSGVKGSDKPCAGVSGLKVEGK